jgi:hypothetical protein
MLPFKRLRELAIPVLELQPFSMTGEGGGQVGEWLRNWNRHAAGWPEVHLDDIASRGVLELARTPILLFKNRAPMTHLALERAWIWGRQRGKAVSAAAWRTANDGLA